MDIEGGEFEVLEGNQEAAYARLDGVDHMVVEFHRRDDRVLAIVDRLRRRGLDLVNRGRVRATDVVVVRDFGCSAARSAVAPPPAPWNDAPAGARST